MRTAQIKGTIKLKGDKSLSHRAIMFAALAKGKSVLRNLSLGADVASTRAVLQSLGVGFEQKRNELIVNGYGLDGFAIPSQRLYCGNSGTTLRLMLGILAGSAVTVELVGDESLNRRPVMRVIEPLRLMRGDLCTVDGDDHPPVTVHGRPLHGIDYDSPVASAQVKSAVLLAGLQADGEVRFREPVRSRDHTERFLMSQGADLRVIGTTITLTPPVVVQPFDYDLPGDISTAAFFVVAALLTQRSELTIRDVLLNETRTGALDILQAMGGDITLCNTRDYHGERVGDLQVRHSSLKGVDTAKWATASFIDEIPILAVAAMCATGRTVIRNVGELRFKESDRAQGIVDVLRACGGVARLTGDDLIIEGGLTGGHGTPEHRGDHRLAMAIEIIKLIRGEEIAAEYQDVIAASAPEFYETLEMITR
jgi:3-phosphoshikimate 1-carboxyvinyltransferase